MSTEREFAQCAICDRPIYRFLGLGWWHSETQSKFCSARPAESGGAVKAGDQFTTMEET
jgi:hypothetical protein